MATDPCPFCRRIAAGDVVVKGRRVTAFPDAHPLSPGHTLVVPLRHEPDFFALHADELVELMVMAFDLQERLRRELGFDGVNLGVNAGTAAGQTVPHAHLHLIPRYLGDTPNPAGGVRWIVPDQARYGEGTP